MARNQKLNEKLKATRRDKILSAALRLFASLGLSATKISDIAAAAEMSQGLLYHYFPSKEAIFCELIQKAFSKMNEAALALEALPIPAREKLERAVAGLLHSIAEEEHFSLHCLLIAHATISEAIPEEARSLIQQSNRVPYQVMERIITAGQAEGTIKAGDPKELALLFWTSINGLAIYRAVHSTEFKAPEEAILLRMFL